MVQPPFLYDRPSAYTFGAPTDRRFNPRAVTQASWAPKAPRPKPNGPLIDFNKHPDTYLALPYGNLNVKPMHPKTETRVKRARGLQLFLRICALLGSLGCLFCVIAINRVSSAVAWIIRIAPGVAICHSLYAVYHFCRSANGRTPASSSSYMLFAGMMDTGLIPFFGFSAFMAWGEYSASLYGWGTLFGDSFVTSKLMFAYFIVSACVGGLFTISLIMDIYLGVLFRKIANMPPDMNPLEPNLTTRHKRNKSEMGITERNMAGSALAARQSVSKIANRRVPFIHTRTDSADSVTVYGNDSAKNSRAEFRKELFMDEKIAYGMSQTSSNDTLTPSRPATTVKPDINARTPGAGLNSHPVRSSDYASPNSQPSWLSYGNRDGAPSPLSDVARTELDNQVRPMSPVSMISSRRASLDCNQAERTNWYPGNAKNNQNDRKSNNKSNVDLSSRGLNQTPTKTKHYQDENCITYGDSEYDQMLSGDKGRTPLSNTNGNAHGRPASFVGSPGKSRFYGYLHSPAGSVGSAQSSPTKYSHIEIEPVEDLARSKSSKSDASGNVELHGSISDDEEYDYRQRHKETGQARVFQTTQWNGTRQTSNSTSYDLHSGYAGLGSDFGKGMGRRRDVSGKAAEEGRGDGYGGFGMSESRDGGIVTGQAMRGGAAGWARFKGL